MHNYQVCKAEALLLGRRSWKLRRTQNWLNVYGTRGTLEWQAMKSQYYYRDYIY
jgi:hypothetical protein